MRLAMPRGDIKWERFIIGTADGEPTSIDFTNVYFTVKKTSKDKDYIFQKSLKRGEIYKIGVGDYELRINPEDTNHLAIGNYKFDIQISYKDLLKQSFVGDFVLKEEVTYYENEEGEEEHADIIIPSQDDEEQDSSELIIVVPDYHLLEIDTSVVVNAEGDYNHIINKPTINGVEVNGDLSLEDLGIESGEGSVPDSLSNLDVDIITGSASSSEALLLLLERGGYISLDNNITLNEPVTITSDTTLNLSKRKLSSTAATYAFIIKSAMLTIENGIFSATGQVAQLVDGGRIHIENNTNIILG